MNKKYIDFVPAKQKAVKKKPSSGIKLGTVEMSEIEVSKVFSERVEKPRAGVTRSKAGSNIAKATPKARFVNTEKVTKRPLSKNVYVKKVTEPVEEKPSAPVKIIDKPEKDSKVGLIVTIIITIILGAAAGTVAFLLLPK